MVDPFADPVFYAGEVVVCKGTCHDYNIREGAEYTVIEYQPRDPTSVGFTFPAYVTFKDDRGLTRTAHASRFKLRE